MNEKSTNKDYLTEDSKKYRQAVGEYAAVHGIAAAMAIFGCTRDKAKYWKKKYLNPYFKPGTHGGARNFKFSKKSQSRVNGLIWTLVKRKPDILTEEIIKICGAAGFDVDAMFLYRTFKLWGWSRKQPLLKQFNKYSGPNIEYYLHFVVCVREIPLRNLKFLDESHFIAKNLQTESIITPANDVTIKINRTTIDTRYSMTLLTTVSQDPPVVFDLREESNSQWDFLQFVTFCCLEKYLAEGDHLIVDNATVHGGSDTYKLLIQLLNAYKVKLIYLPTYSPELNPCEFVFAQIKRWMKLNRTTDPFWLEIARGTHQVSYENMIAYYKHCICIDTVFQ